MAVDNTAREPVATDIRIVDPFRASMDPALPFVQRALDPTAIGDLIAPLVCRGNGESPPIRLRDVRVVRHRPGRRCVVEYRFDGTPETTGLSPPWVFGKLRARGADVRTHQVLESLWQCGFQLDSGRSAAVPEPLGVVPELHMTIQRGAPGRLATEMASGPHAADVMGRIAEALHDLHFAQVPTRRRHTLADELRILKEQLGTVTRAHPEWSQRIERVLLASEKLASRLQMSPLRGIHRDFYADQVVVDGAQLTLLDLDLYAVGDPAVDVGNFVAHLTEQALRCFGDPDALVDAERALEQRYLELSDDVTPIAVRTYSTLTLARHVHISSRIAERNHMTSDILELCERRLGIGERAHSRQKFNRTRRAPK